MRDDHVQPVCVMTMYSVCVCMCDILTMYSLCVCTMNLYMRVCVCIRTYG